MNLTKPQKLIYDMERVIGGSINVICGCMLLPGAKPVAELTAAVNQIFQLNDALRIRISEEDGQPSQQITPYAEKNIAVLRFDSKAELDSCAQREAQIPMDFYGDLCDIKVLLLPEQCGLLVKFHHIVGDAWTIALIGTQFNAIMNCEEPSACSYCEYVESEKAYLESLRYANDRTFFLEQFKKCDEVTYLSEKKVDSYSAIRKTFVLNAAQTQRIKDYATQNKTSPYTLFMTVLAVYLNRIRMNTEKFYLGTAVLNRSSARERLTMGMFINTVPMLMELENEKSFAENLTTVGKTVFSAFRHQKFNYGDVLSTIRKEYNFSEKLYDVMLSYQNATITGGDCETTWYHCGMQNESLQIHIDDRDNGGVFRIHYDYQTDKFTVQEIERLHTHLMTLLQAAIENDTKKLYELELLTLEEKQKILYDFNDTAMDYPKDKCVHQLFEEQVKKTPDRVALVACDKTLTYAELNAQVNRIAYSLTSRGIRSGDIVAFSLSRRSYLIATMLGILKTGAAYLPVDPDFPQERIDYMLNDSNAKCFITDESVAELLDNDHSYNPNVEISSDGLCYTLFTSGTTGKPKATMIMHRNLANFCDNNNNNNYQCALVNTCSAVLAVGAMTFDISVFEVFVTLLNGLTLVLADEMTVHSPSRIAELICAHKIDALHGTPSKLSAYLDNTAFQAAAKNIKIMMIGAEVFSEELLKRVQKYSDATIFNGYGPTEATIAVSFGRLN